MKKGEILLFIGAFIWGSAFVAQSVAMDDIGPWTFNFMRALIAVITLTILIPFFRDKNHKKTNEEKKTLIQGGLICGFFLCLAAITQQIGISMTTVGKAGFITALYVVLVPVFNIFLGKRAKPIIWLSVVLAACGLYFISVNESFSIGMADIYVIACAILYAFQIIGVDHFSPKLNGMELSRAQFTVMAIMSFLPMMLFENPDIHAILNASVPILYTGVLSSGIGFTFQILGQRDTDPAIASIIMSLESCFAALSGFILLHQTLSLRELFGCALMFTAIIIVQIPELIKKKKTE